MINVEYNNSTLNIGGKSIELDTEIDKVVERGDKCIILENYADVSEENANSNILAYDADGEFVWRISESPGSDESDNPYTGIGTKEARTIGYTWKGMAVEIDTESGEWEPYGLTK